MMEQVRKLEKVMEIVENIRINENEFNGTEKVTMENLTDVEREYAEEHFYLYEPKDLDEAKFEYLGYKVSFKDNGDEIVYIIEGEDSNEKEVVERCAENTVYELMKFKRVTERMLNNFRKVRYFKNLLK